MSNSTAHASDDLVDHVDQVASLSSAPLTASGRDDVPLGLRGQTYEPPAPPPVLDLRRIEGTVLPAYGLERVASIDIPKDVMAAMASLNLAAPYVPTRQSRSTRFINLRGRGSYRGALSARLGGINRMIVFESLLELHCLHILLSDITVVDIWDQAPPILFRKVSGEWSEHTLDYRVEYAGGRLVGYVVKPFDLVMDEHGQPTDFARDMRRVRAAAGHEIRIVTEKSFSRIQVQDARTMHRWVRQADPEADNTVRALLPTLRGSFPIRTIRDLSGLEGRAFGAVVRAFREGLLVKAGRTRLDIDTIVQVNHG